MIYKLNPLHKRNQIKIPQLFSAKHEAKKFKQFESFLKFQCSYKKYILWRENKGYLFSMLCYKNAHVCQFHFQTIIWKLIRIKTKEL